jgi:hypothetical protein
MTAFAPRVSAVLRSAGLPVIRYGTHPGNWLGIRVGNEGNVGGRAQCSVHFHMDGELEWSDQAMAVLLAKGFQVERLPGMSMLTVRASSPGQQEDIAGVVAASGLDMVQPTRSEWLVNLPGRRGAYSIRQAGQGDRARFSVQGHPARALGKNLRTMRSAIDIIENDIKEQS